MMQLNGHVNKKGIDPLMDYEAVVVDNNDPKQIGQVRARIVGLMDDIEDKHLPWISPKTAHLEGYRGGSDVHAFGTFCVPQRNAKISVKFPSKNIYEGEYTTDIRITEADQLPESLVNYPHRIVMRLSQGMQVIMDRSTREVFITSGGDWHFTVLGDVNQTIVGNQQLTVTDTKNDIPSYILNDPVMIAKALTPDPKRRIKFKGGAKGNAGNQYTLIKGNQTTEIKGNRVTKITGTDTLDVKGAINQTSGGAVKIKGTRIDLN